MLLQFPTLLEHMLRLNCRGGDEPTPALNNAVLCVS